jgi:hypothetical protein
MVVGVYGECAVVVGVYGECAMVVGVYGECAMVVGVCGECAMVVGVCGECAMVVGVYGECAIVAYSDVLVRGCLPVVVHIVEHHSSQAHFFGPGDLGTHRRMVLEDDDAVETDYALVHLEHLYVRGACGE